MQNVTVECVRWLAQAKEPKALPRLLLARQGPWDDDGFETLFDVHYQDTPGQPMRLLGSTKILQRGNRTTTLPREMPKGLPPGTGSLGQTIDFYQAVEELGESTSRAVLSALRDVTHDESVRKEIENEPGFSESLLRFSEAARIFRYREQPLHRTGPAPAEVVFSYTGLLPGFGQPHEVEFCFSPQPARLGRIVVLVGRSGTGKTTLLARLASALWGLPQSKMMQEQLLPRRPPIGRVIAVSYAALDVFARPPHRFGGSTTRPAFDNYCYCGFRGPKGELSTAVLGETMRTDMDEIQRLGRRARWQSMVEAIGLNEDPAVSGQFSDDAAFREGATHLGAGQKIALSALTRLLALLRNGAFVLFDEPEQHLHPSLLSSMLRVLHDWLEQFDAYCVVATHSPIVLQEIPGRNVRVLDRDGDIPIVRAYDDESFGQNLSEIVTRVFGVRERERNYATLLRELIASGLNADEIERAFGRPLSLHARMALEQIANRDRDREDS
jgi:ABC-type thiamine transport system ATPase subunit